MSNKTFHSISRQECLIVSKAIVRNSNKKWRAAKKLAILEEYGGAISFSIISVEELIKAFILAMDGYGFDFRNMKGVDKFFKDHEIRYTIAFFMFVLSFIWKELQIVLTKIQNNEIDLEKIGEANSSPEDFIKKKKFWGFRKIIALKRELDWFSNINKLRQDGMYCDYRDSFKTPLSFTDTDYLIVYDRLLGVREIAKGLVDTFVYDFESDEKADKVKEIIEKLRTDFKDKDYYSKISELLKSIGKDKPLNILKENFENFKF